jgi:membrane-associated protein
MPTTNKNTTQNQKSLQQTEEQTPVVPIESAEVMYYVDSRGLLWVMIIIILEMATPIGMLFPTDAIVFGGGMYFSAKWNIRWGIWMIMLLFSFAVVLWDLLGYRWGSLLSPKLQTMEDNWIFKKKYITMCEHYFNEYGNKTMLISKFLPIRSMIPLVAWVILKPFFNFFMQSILSAILWVWSLLWISYFIIWLIPEASNHIWLLTFLFVVLPQVVSVWYMILPAMKRYEAKLIQAKDNFQHIADEVSVIWAQFAAIWHEMKEIVTKIAENGNEITSPLPTNTSEVQVSIQAPVQQTISSNPPVQ